MTELLNTKQNQKKEKKKEHKGPSPFSFSIRNTKRGVFFKLLTTLLPSNYHTKREREGEG